MKERASGAQQKILDAASAVFARGGFAGARVDEIARRAGVNKAMLYYHVGNKQDLYTAVLARNFDRMEKALVEAATAAGSAYERLRAIIVAVNRALGEIPDHPRIVLREFASGGANLEPEILDRLARFLGTTRGLLADGVEGGEFRGTDPLLTHLALIGASLILNTATPIRQRVSEIDLDIGVPEDSVDVGAFLADLLLHGIARPGTGEAT